MNASAPLQADREQIQRFVQALFVHADPGGYVSLRSFHDDESKVFGITAHQLTDDLDRLIDAALIGANEAARAGRPVVFAPPIATFGDAAGATEANLANGLALSVECDAHAADARQKLEAILGPATIVVASGGEWPDPETGELEPKLHLHWRLNEPTRDQVDHQALKHARSLAANLVGSDASSKPAVHPMRWPGSWHRKAAPRLARIVAETDNEIELNEAVERLEEACGGSERVRGGETEPSAGSGPAGGESRDTAQLITQMLTGADYHAPLAALAMRFLKDGMADARVVMTLRGHMEAVPDAIRDIKEGVAQPGRWQSRYDDIPRAVSTARAKLGNTQAKPAGDFDVTKFRLDAFTDGEPPPRRYLLKPLMPLGTVGLIFGPGGVGKSMVALEMCLTVAIRTRFGGSLSHVSGPLGGVVPAEAAGASVFLTLEDDQAEVHRRVVSLDPDGTRREAPCYVIPGIDLPDFDPTLVSALGRTAVLSEFANTGLDTLLENVARAAGCPVRLLVLDPAGDFLNADENDATFVKLLMRRLRVAAARHGCTIILLGHVAKTIDSDGPSMRGSSAWISNSRFAYALWRPPADDANKQASQLRVQADRIVWGNLVKANHAGAPISRKAVFVRDEAGRLIVSSPADDAQGGLSDEALLPLLVKACADYAAAGLPFAYSGVAGLWTGRADLPEPLASLPKHRLEQLGNLATKRGELVKARTTLSQGAPKYLDIPDGPLAKGEEVEDFKGSRREALARRKAAQEG